MNNQWFSKIAVWLVIGMVLFTVFKQFDTRSTAGSNYMGYSEFLDEVRARTKEKGRPVWAAFLMSSGGVIPHQSITR